MRNIIPAMLIICGAIAVFLGLFEFEALKFFNSADRAGCIGGGVLVIGWAACMFDEGKDNE